jgi:hypothetical protein
MPGFKHYLTTRFNATIYRNKAKLRLSPEEWMDHRLKLFTTFTLPSIMEQSCQDFTWLILMDKQTPDRYLQELESFRYPNLKLVCQVSAQRPWIQAFEPGQYDVLTTRIDNDDAFHQDTIAAIQRTYREQCDRQSDPWVIVLPFGLIFDLASNDLWVMEYWYNNCPTLVESRLDPQTIWQWDHSNIPAEVGRCFIKDKLYWLQVVHDQNIRNAVPDNHPTKILHKEIRTSLDYLSYYGVDAGRLPAP